MLLPLGRAPTTPTPCERSRLSLDTFTSPPTWVPYVPEVASTSPALQRVPDSE